MKVNLQICNGVIVGYSTYPIDNKTAVEITKEQLEMMDKFCGFINTNFELLEENLLLEKKKKATLTRIQKLKNWFDTYYTVNEQKYRRLNYLFTTGVDTEETRIAHQKLVELYNQAEENRLEINKLEQNLML